MKLITWCDGFSTGIDEVDRQHRQIIDCINDLHTALNAAGEARVVTRVMGELAQYADRHFRDEEALMQRHGYPALADHRADHGAFATRLAGYQAQIGESPDLAFELINFLSEWLEDHILGADQKYVPYVNSAGTPEAG